VTSLPGYRLWTRTSHTSISFTPPRFEPTRASQAWQAAGRWGSRAGTVFSGVAGGANQWMEDSGRKDLTTAERGGRAAGAGAWVAGGSWAGGAAGAWAGGEAGAAIGATIGSVIPGAGTAAGAAIGGTIGAIGGAVAGSGAGSWVADKTKAGAVWVGQEAGALVDDGIDLAKEGWHHGEQVANWAHDQGYQLGEKIGTGISHGLDEAQERWDGFTQDVGDGIETAKDHFDGFTQDVGDGISNAWDDTERVREGAGKVLDTITPW
jgi:hypothetical protein